MTLKKLLTASAAAALLPAGAALAQDTVDPAVLQTDMVFILNSLLLTSPCS